MGNFMNKVFPCGRRRKKAAGTPRNRKKGPPAVAEVVKYDAVSCDYMNCDDIDTSVYSLIDENNDAAAREDCTNEDNYTGKERHSDPIDYCHQNEKKSKTTKYAEYLNYFRPLPTVPSSVPLPSRIFCTSGIATGETQSQSTENAEYSNCYQAPPFAAPLSSPSLEVPMCCTTGDTHDTKNCMEAGNSQTMLQSPSVGKLIKLELAVSYSSSTALSQRARLSTMHRQLVMKSRKCETEHVELRGKCLSRIPEDTLSKAQSVKSLDLAYNVGIDVATDITGFQLLTSLSLRECWLCEFPLGVLCLKKLKLLDLSNTYPLLEAECAIKDTYCALQRPTRRRKIKQLLLREDAGIPSLPSDIGKLSELEELYISGNLRLSVLPSSMEELRSLKKLDMSWCGFTRLPDVCGRFNSIECLKLCGNDYQVNVQMCPKISLENLRMIDLSECGITQLPDIIKFAPMLECLHAGGNDQLVTIPGEIAELKMLKKIDLNYCSFSEIPEIIGIIPDLEELNIGGNTKVDYIPVTLAGLKSLRKLNLSSCCFAALPSDIGDFVQLEDLNISLNAQICTFPSSLTKLKNLKKLRLHGCSFSVLPDVVGELTALQFLDASSNRLQSYPQATLRLRKLTRLDLSNSTSGIGLNRIEHIPLQVISSTLSHLNIENNPMTFPPVDVCKQGINAIRSYMLSLIREGRVCADTVTVIGEPCAGKSSVVKSLVANRPCVTEEKECHQVVDQRYINISDKHWIKLNCFGGHIISEAIIPVLSPSNGLTLIVYNMSKDPESRFEKGENAGGLDDVRKWMILTLMRCVQPRIIVVGTHADKMEKTLKEALERQMKEHISELLSSVQKELMEYGTEMEFSRGRRSPVRHRKNFLTAANGFEVEVLTISCSLETDFGIRLLSRFIDNKVRKSEPVPSHWCLLMCKIMAHQQQEDAQVPYLTWEEITEICRCHSDLPESTKHTTLVPLIQYLHDTSHVIWIKEHAMLSKYVFHQPPVILNACKKVLAYFWQRSLNIESDETSHKSYRQHCFSDGYVSDRLLHHLLELPFRSTDILIELLKHFNIISEVTSSPTGRLFVNLTTLPDDPPAELVELIEVPFTPRIGIKLVFLDYIMPREFSNESLVTILQWVHSKSEKPLIWRNGAFFKVYGVYVRITQSSGLMELTASSKSEKEDLWKVLCPILSLMDNSITQHCRGPPPLVKVECAGCRCCGRHQSNSTNKERDHTTLECLISPPTRCSWPTSFCSDCKKDIPRCLTSPHQQGHYNKEDQRAVAKFLNDLRESCRCSAENLTLPKKKNCKKTKKELKSKTPDLMADEDAEYANPRAYGQTHLMKKIRTERACLVNDLTIEDIRLIVDKLYSKYLINEGQKEIIEKEASNGERSNAARRLLDTIENRGHDAATALVDELGSEKINRRDLLERIANANSVL